MTPSTELVLERPSRSFQPGERICGSVRVHSAKHIENARVVLTLFWRQSSPNQDTRSPDMRQEELACGTLSSGAHELPFDVAVPNGPYSFNGQLIHLVWHVQATVSCAAGSSTSDIPFSLDGALLDTAPVVEESDGVQIPVRISPGPAEDQEAESEPLEDVEVTVAPMDIPRGAMLTCRFTAEGDTALRLKQQALSARARLACREVASGDSWQVAAVYLGEWMPIGFIERAGRRRGRLQLQVPFDAATSLEGTDEVLWSTDFELLDNEGAVVQAMSYKFKVWEPEALDECREIEFEPDDEATEDAPEEEPNGLLDILRETLDDLEQPHDVKVGEDGTIVVATSIDIAENSYRLIIEVGVEQKLVDVYLYAPTQVPKKRIAEACVLANLLNRGVAGGRFAISDDGFVQYHNRSDIGDSSPADTLITRMISGGMWAFEVGFDSFAMLASSAAPVSKIIAKFKAQQAKNQNVKPRDEEMPVASQEKAAFLRKILEFGNAIIHVDTDVSGVLCPTDMRSEEELADFELEQEDPKRTTDATGIRAMLSLGRKRYACAFPWESILLIQAKDRNCLHAWEPASPAGCDCDDACPMAVEAPLADKKRKPSARRSAGARARNRRT